jgi:hypothetical protein
MQVRIIENSWVARMAAGKLKADRVAIVFGKTIYLHNTSKEDFLENKNWVCHELKHVEQYQRHGFAGFLFKYLVNWVRHGYYNNKFEIEARENEGNRKLLVKYKID